MSTREPHVPERGTPALEECAEFLLDELGHTRARIVRVDEPFEHIVEMFVDELVEHALSGAKPMNEYRPKRSPPSALSRRKE